jgi:hypothetical protein
MHSANLLSNTSHLSASPLLQSSVDPETALLMLADVEHPQRPALEQFIVNGFARHYQASVKQFMPYLAGVQRRGVFQAALGIRFARQQPLFTEQYLPLAAEHMLKLNGIDSQRSEIAEIGHLYADSAQALMPLFVLTVQALYQLNTRQLVFAATTELSRMLGRHGLDLTVLAKADPALLGDKAQDWGSYYHTQPQVCALSVQQVAESINADKRLQQLIFRHWPQLHALVDSLQESV